MNATKKNKRKRTVWGLISILPLNINLNSTLFLRIVYNLNPLSKDHFPWHIRSYHSKHKILQSSGKEKTK